MTIQKFDEPSTWGNDKNAFIDLLLNWIAVNDLDCNLYDFLADIRTGDSVGDFEYDEIAKSFEKMFHEKIDEWSNIHCSMKREWYEAQYLKGKEEAV